MAGRRPFRGLGVDPMTRADGEDLPGVEVICRAIAGSFDSSSFGKTYRFCCPAALAVSSSHLPSGLICWRTGQVRGSFLALAAVLAVAMATVSAGLLFLHAEGAPKPLSLIGMIPFAVTGLIVLRQLLGGTRFGRRAPLNFSNC